MNIFTEMKKYDFFTKMLGGTKFSESFSTFMTLSGVTAPQTFTKIATFTPSLRGRINDVDVNFSYQDGNNYSGTISIQIKDENTGEVLKEHQISYNNQSSAISSITLNNIDVQAYNKYGIYYKHELPTSTSLIKYYPSKIQIYYTVGYPVSDYVKLNPFKE